MKNLVLTLLVICLVTLFGLSSYAIYLGSKDVVNETLYYEIGSILAFMVLLFTGLLFIYIFYPKA